jgi:hypothetical protein
VDSNLYRSSKGSAAIIGNYKKLEEDLNSHSNITGSHVRKNMVLFTLSL